MKQLIVPFLSGVLFAIGLTLSGMTMPSKVIGFLDFFGGAWDPSLMFVMGGAAGTYALAFWVLKPAHKPLFDSEFRLPSVRKIDGRLLTGAALFGIGWGLGGFCPGPGIVAAASFGTDALVFFSAMIAGMIAFRLFAARGNSVSLANAEEGV
ncbi:MAG: DUF6691 family protein [Myxococcota bacterium]